MLSLNHSGSLWHNMALTLALSGAPRLTRSLLRGSPSRGRVATVYPNLLYSKHCKIIFRWEMSKLPQLFFLQPYILLPSFFADLQPSTSHMILWLDTKLSARSAKLKKKRGRIKVCLLFLASFITQGGSRMSRMASTSSRSNSRCYFFFILYFFQGAISSLFFCICFKVLFCIHVSLHHQSMMRNSWCKEVILEIAFFRLLDCWLLGPKIYTFMVFHDM